VFVTNGCGLILECRVQAIARSATVAEVVSVVENHAPGPERILALGTIKKDKFERAFEQCAELGITRFVPFVSENARVKAYSGRFTSRLRKIGIVAIKQSFRSFLPVVDDPVSFEELLTMARAMPRVVVGGQDAPNPASFGTDDTLVVVGPEAGFSAAEEKSLEDAGARLAGVSPHRLRSETAAVALVAAMWRDD
jgi:16S rRNA (uracil1498-N3)-methyltransferase